MSNAFTMFAGDTPRLTGAVENSDQTPFDLTGWAIQLHGAGGAIDGGILSAPAGTYFVDLTAGFTGGLHPGTYPYRISISKGAQAFTLFSSKFTLLS